VIVHCDADAFYAAVEVRDNPDLKGKPIGIGGNSMLSTASYEARKFGVRSAMPGYIAKQLCPELIFVRPRYEAYREASAKMQAVMATYDPDFKAVSLDEAYLDLTAYIAQLSPTAIEHLPLDGSKQPAERVVHELRARIFDATQLTVSAGIACNRMLAKIGSDQNKPNGQWYLPPVAEDVRMFMSKLPVRKLPGIGKVGIGMDRARYFVGMIPCP
jgi:DNA polymerase kappa